MLSINNCRRYAPSSFYFLCVKNAGYKLQNRKRKGRRRKRKIDMMQQQQISMMAVQPCIAINR